MGTEGLQGPGGAPGAGPAPFPGVGGEAVGPGISAGVLLARKALIPLVPNAGPRCPRCGNRLLGEGSKSCPGCGVDPSSGEAAALMVPVGSWIRELFLGASYVPRGLWKIATTPSLWAVASLPFLFNLIFVVAISWVAITFLGDWLKVKTAPDAFKEWHGFFWGLASYVLICLGYLVRWLAFIMIPALTAWLMTTAPFRVIFASMSTLVAERTEQAVLHAGASKEPLDFGRLQAAIVIAIVDTLLLGLLEAVLYLALSPIALIPFVGTFLWFVMPRAIFAGMDQTDPNFCRKSYYTREKVALWRERHWRFFGFGCAFFFLLGIPFVNALVFPTVACGSCLLYLELDRK